MIEPPDHSKVGLKKVLGTTQLWAIAVGMVISGQNFGWNYGWASSGTIGFLIATLLVTVMYITFIFSYLFSNQTEKHQKSSILLTV
jgi:ethanolamine permease